MMMFDINKITRENVKRMQAYSSARDEYQGDASIWLDANENPFNTKLNRYPDPLQWELKQKLAELKEVETHQIFIGNGSDEAIDLLFRAFCEPRLSKAIIFPPTYGMYEVSASLNNVDIIRIPLSDNFDIPDVSSMQQALNLSSLLFICSPNNPTGNVIDLEKIQSIAENFQGIVVVDEAYIDFSKKESAISLLPKLPNLVVLQTLSKAYGLAGARIGMAFGHPAIIAVLNKIKPPYNINTLSMQVALETLQKKSSVDKQIAKLIQERDKMRKALKALGCVIQVFPSEANFLLVEFKNAEMVFQYLLKKGIVIRNRTSHVKDCLRITIGTEEENKKILNVLKSINP